MRKSADGASLFALRQAIVPLKSLSNHCARCVAIPMVKTAVIFVRFHAILHWVSECTDQNKVKIHNSCTLSGLCVSENLPTRRQQSVLKDLTIKDIV
jgi:hypothetical protein